MEETQNNDQLKGTKKMNKKAALDFWNEYLRLASRGTASTTAKNPAIVFTREAKCGKYDLLDDLEYEDRLADCEQLSALWQDRPSRTAGELLLTALDWTDISDSCLGQIADLLAECSAGTDYRARNTRELAALPDFYPRAVYDRLCQHVLGQDAAKRVAATVLFNHLSGRRSNTLFCGPSGCGKTEIWRCLARDYPGLVRIFDGTHLHPDGWKGSLHLRDIFAEKPGPQGLILVLDEADKLCCEPCFGSNDTNFAAMVQNELLKLMDGDVIQFGDDGNRAGFEVDCSRVSVVLLGAFETLLDGKSRRTGGLGFGAKPRQTCDYGNTTITYDDLITAGMRREIAGRVNRIVSLRPLSISDYRAILTGPVLDDLQMPGKLRIEIDAATVDRLAKQAASMGLGVRWMRSMIQCAVDDILFDDPLQDSVVVNIPSEPMAG